MNVSPITLEAVIRVESGGNPLALNLNHLAGPQPHPATVAEAATVARSYIAHGYNVDLGLMQVNSRNLVALGYTVEQVLDPGGLVTEIIEALRLSVTEAAQALRITRAALSTFVNE